MAKFLQILVGSATRIYSAENIITTERTAATTTVITYNHAQAGFDILTLTHATDAATTKVVDLINTGIAQAHKRKSDPDVFIKVTLPVAVSTAVFS
jgi:hypothetical protein